MSRPQRPTEGDHPDVVEFARDLRRLREAAGCPPYRHLARRAHYSHAALSEAANGRKLPSLAVTRAYVAACQGDVAVWEQRWRQLAAELAGPADDQPPDAPYIGLRSFQVEDSDRFFGRQRVLADLVALVRRHRLVVVLGASGSGKSSLLRAGLLAHARAAGLDEAGPGPTLLVTPGGHPIDECAVRVAAWSGRAAAALRAEFTAHRENLHLRVRQALVEQSHHGDLLLVVDQFEELFTQCDDVAEREAFLALLVAAADASTARIRVVLGIRADFLPHCAHYPALVRAINDAAVLVGPLSTDDLRLAITEPARHGGYTVEAPLLARIIADATAQPAGLPLVSHALLMTWQRRRGTTLTVAGYEASGGIAHAVARSAENLYGTLNTEHQATAKQLFLRLVTTGDGAAGERSGDTRRRMSPDELRALDPMMGEVVSALVAARLVTSADTGVEIAHEALIRCWPRLQEWLATDRDGLRVRRQLAEAVDAWVSVDHDPGALYRGLRLGVARDWAQRNPGWFSQREREFLDASDDTENRERRAVARRHRRSRWLAAGLAVLVAVSAGLAVWVPVQQHNTDVQRQLAISRQLAAESTATAGPNESIMLAIAAFQQAHTVEARSALLSSQAVLGGMRVGSGNVLDTVFSPDGALVATAGADGSVALFDVHQAYPIATLVRSGGLVLALAFSPNGRVLATAGFGGAVTLWDVAGDRKLATLPEATDWTNALAFSPDGRLLAVGTDNHSVALWEVAHQRRTGVVPLGNGAAVAFSRDGRVLVEESADGTVELWNPATRMPIATLTGPSTNAMVVQSADGLLAFGPIDGSSTVAIWQHVAELGGRVGTGELSSRMSMAISPDGRTLATSGWDGVQLWDMATRAHIANLGTDVLTMAFSPDGRVLATADADANIQVWDMSTRTVTATIVGRKTLASANSLLIGLAFSPDGQILFSLGDDGRANQWMLDPERVAELECPQARFTITPAVWARTYPNLPYESVC